MFLLERLPQAGELLGGSLRIALQALNYPVMRLSQQRFDAEAVGFG